MNNKTLEEKMHDPNNPQPPSMNYGVKPSTGHNLLWRAGIGLKKKIKGVYASLKGGIEGIGKNNVYVLRSDENSPLNQQVIDQKKSYGFIKINLLFPLGKKR